MIGKLFEALYSKVLVNIVVKRSSTDIYIEICSKKHVITQEHKSFDADFLDDDMLEFISSYIAESPYYYISVLDTSVEQGAVGTCEKKKLSSYFDPLSSKYICQNSWAFHTSKDDIYMIEKKFARVGVDFIFSPFTLLSKFFKDKIDLKLAMYILIQDSFISLAVFENSKLLFAEHLDMETSNEKDDDLLSQAIADEEIDFDENESIDLDDVAVMDDMEDLEDFGNIEDLDDIDELDDFDEAQDVEEEFHQSPDIEPMHDETNFNEDYQRFSLIQTALAHYYNGPNNESEFVENIYIADGVGVSPDLKHYLEEEMFLNVYLRRIEIPMQVSELAKEELGV